MGKIYNLVLLNAFNTFYKPRQLIIHNYFSLRQKKRFFKNILFLNRNKIQTEDKNFYFKASLNLSCY